MSSFTLPHGIPVALGGLGLHLVPVPNNTLAYVELDVTGIGLYSTITITRTNTVTGLVTTVRGADTVSTGGASAAVYFDYEAPLNVPVIYTITANTLDVYVADPVTIVVSGNVYWLKNVSREGLSTTVTVSTITVSREARILSKQNVLGRKNPIVVTDVRGGRSGSMSLLSYDSKAGKDAVINVLAPGDTLFFQAPAASEFPDMYFIAGTVEEQWGGVSTDLTRVFSFDYTETDSPASTLSSIGFNSWLAVTNFGSWSDLLAKRVTWLDVLSSPYTIADA